MPVDVFRRREGELHSHRLADLERSLHESEQHMLFSHLHPNDVFQSTNPSISLVNQIETAKMLKTRFPAHYYGLILLTKLFSYNKYKQKTVIFSDMTDMSMVKTAEIKSAINKVIKFYINHGNAHTCTTRDVEFFRKFSRYKYASDIINAICRIPRFKGFISIPEVSGVNNISLKYDDLSEDKINKIIKELVKTNLNKVYFYKIKNLKKLIKVIIAKGFGFNTSDALRKYGMAPTSYKVFMETLCSKEGHDLIKIVNAIEKEVMDNFSSNLSISVCWNGCLI